MTSPGACTVRSSVVENGSAGTTEIPFATSSSSTRETSSSRRLRTISRRVSTRGPLYSHRLPARMTKRLDEVSARVDLRRAGRVQVFESAAPRPHLSLRHARHQ